MTEAAIRTPVVGAERKFHIIDTDVHERAELPALVPYLEPMWQKYITDFGWVPERNLPYAQFAAGGLDRADAKLPDGRPGGSDLGLLRKQLLDEYDIDYAVLTGWLDASALHPGWPEFKTALMTAYNNWQIEHWLEKDQRLLGSIHVNAHDPQGAVREEEARIQKASRKALLGKPKLPPLRVPQWRSRISLSIQRISRFRRAPR